MTSRLTALAATHLRSSSVTQNGLLDPQALQFARSRDKGIDRSEKAGLQKRLAGDPYLIVDLNKCEVVQKKPLYLEIYNLLQASFKAQTFTTDITLKGMNRDVRKNY